MSIPTVGEQRFRAQLLDALGELADAIRENTGALRELAGTTAGENPGPRESA